MKTYQQQQKRESRTLEGPSRKADTHYPVQFMRVIQMRPQEVDKIAKTRADIDTGGLEALSEGAHDFSPGFYDRQKEYQNYLTGALNMSLEEIMNYHKSAGYEFEFASFKEPGQPFDKDKEILPSHEPLGESEVLASQGFNLPFCLETDSNNTLEMVTPPFIFFKSSIPNGVLLETFDKYNVASDEINAVLKRKELPINDPALIQEFVSKDFGKDWKIPNGNGLLAIPNEKHGQTYGQANVSMSAKEIVEFLHRSDADKTQGFHNMSVSLFDGIKKLLLSSKQGQNPNLQGGILLYSRLVSNLFGIPSLLYRKEKQERPEPNYATEIKELLGLWIKTQPHVIMLDYMEGMKGEKDEYLNMINETKVAVLERIESDLKGQLSGVINWRKSLIDNYFHDKFEKEKAGILATFNSSGDIPGISKKVEELTTEIELQSEEEKDKATSVISEKWNGQYIPAVKKELENFIGLIKDSAPHLPIARPKFPQEDFGLGHGVRKDTYLGSFATEEEWIYVGELRNRDSLMYFGVPQVKKATSSVKPPDPLVNPDLTSSSSPVSGDSAKDFTPFDFGGGGDSVDLSFSDSSDSD